MRRLGFRVLRVEPTLLNNTSLQNVLQYRCRLPYEQALSRLLVAEQVVPREQLELQISRTNASGVPSTFFVAQVITLERRRAGVFVSLMVPFAGRCALGSRTRSGTPAPPSMPRLFCQIIAEHQTHTTSGAGRWTQEQRVGAGAGGFIICSGAGHGRVSRNRARVGAGNASRRACSGRVTAGTGACGRASLVSLTGCNSRWCAS